MVATLPPVPTLGNSSLAIRPGQALVSSGNTIAVISPAAIPEVSGYCFINGKARDNINGKYLRYVLQNKDIDLGTEPPFRTITKDARFATYGVVKINNIPFTVNYQEIVQFVNRFAPTPMIKKNHDGYPIHIIMEKPTGKTMDCFVEFPNHEAAYDCVSRYEYQQIGKLSKLGTRNVTLDLSNQAELMEAIFPRARLIQFDKFNGEPHVIPQRRDKNWSEGFRGFITLEEVYGIIKFAESPGRSPFVLKCHQRVYESLISTLYKFPWASTGTYTVAARNALFEAAYKQLTVLCQKVGCSLTPSPMNQIVPYQLKNDPYPFYSDPYIDNREVGLSQTLLFDLLFAAVNVPAFNYLQKLAICQAAGSHGRGIEISQFAEHWPFQTLGPAKGVPNDTIKFWLELFDTGYDLMFRHNIKTTFERFITFTRNKVGSLMGEWTKEGTELPFELATRLEYAVMMIYVDRGRDQWCFERCIEFESWETITLNEFLRSMSTEKQLHDCFQDEDISPRTSIGVTLDGIHTLGAITAAPAAVNSSSSIDQGRRKSSFNPATATEFVPTSIRNDSSSSSRKSSYLHISDSMLTISSKPKAIRPIQNLAPINTEVMPTTFTNPWTTPSTTIVPVTDTPSDKSNGGMPLNMNLNSTMPITVNEQMRGLSLTTSRQGKSDDTATASFVSKPAFATSPAECSNYRRSSAIPVISDLPPTSYTEVHPPRSTTTDRTAVTNSLLSSASAIPETTKVNTQDFGPIGSQLASSSPTARNPPHSLLNGSMNRQLITPTIDPNKTRAYSVPITNPTSLPSYKAAQLHPHPSLDLNVNANARPDTNINAGTFTRPLNPPHLATSQSQLQFPPRLSSTELWAGLGKKWLENLH